MSQPSILWHDPEFGTCHGIRWECAHIGSQVVLSLWYSGGWTTLVTEWNDPQPRRMVLEDGGYRTLIPIAGILSKLANVPDDMLKITLESDEQVKEVRDAIKTCLAHRDRLFESWPDCLTGSDRRYISDMIDKGGGPEWASLEHPEDFERRYAKEAKDNPWIATALRQSRRQSRD